MDRPVRDIPMILVVDDIDQNLQLICQILKRSMPCSLGVASDGVQALEMVEKHHPDLVLMDIMMPRMNGLEVCRKMKADPCMEDIPVIFLTARVDDHDIAMGFDAGGADYICKPIKTRELLSRVSLQLQLQQSKQTIIHQNSELRQLLHILCHDLSNPLYSCLSVAEIIEDENVSDEVRELVSIFRTSIQSAQEIIDNIREIQSLEEGKVHLKMEPYDLLELTQSTVDGLRQRFREKQIDVICNIEADIEVVVERTTFIHTILSNLLTNAIKFSPRRAQIVIAARITRDIPEKIAKNGCAPEMVLLTVEDQGMGIPSEILGNLFDLRQQTSRPGTEGEKGTGFGMPLVRRFVEYYGGHIQVESTDAGTDPDNHGTRASLWLPLHRTSAVARDGGEAGSPVARA